MLLGTLLGTCAALVSALAPALALALALALNGCTGHPPAPKSTLAAAPKGSGPRAPVNDARGPKSEHPDALGRLLDAGWGTRVDRRRIISLPLPDASAWTHVRYWGVTTLAGYRYGEDHHVALAVFAFTAPPGGATIEGCSAKFHAWGDSRAKAFDIDVGDARVDEITWPPGGNKTAKIYVFDARRRSILGTKRYAAAYAIYPAWNEACLMAGFAVPERDAPDAARQLRDRLVRDALPGLIAKPGSGAIALEAKSDVD